MIACVYCGQSHDNPAAVRACWRTHRTARATTPNPAAPNADVNASTTALYAAATHIDQRGPGQLGRNAVVHRDDPNPAQWEPCQRVDIGLDTLADPEPMVRQLRQLRQHSHGVVFALDPNLAGRFGALHPPDSTETRPLHRLDPSFTFWLDELHALVFSNSFDGRDGAVPATQAGAVWVDGGPLRMIEPIDGVPVVSASALPAATTSVDASRAPRAEVADAALAPDQLDAVTHNQGSARIIAPAGSGKTRVLVERARHLIDRWNIPAESVCLVAFNKRAQLEMRERTANLRGLQVRTLNSLALAIANGQAPFAPQAEQLRTVTERDVRHILESFVNAPRRLNTDPLAAWIDALSAIRLGMRDPADVERDYGGDVAGLAEVYERFTDVLRRQRQVDFDHQIVAAIEVLLRQPEARRRAQRACQVLLVDEFQDLTPAHLLLIRLLAGPLGSVFAVGDDDQTIYGYNGADPAWLIEFDRWFPGAGSHALEVNYRCPAGVVAITDRLLRHNTRRVPKTILARPGAPEGGWHHTNGTDPVSDAVEAIEAWLEQGAPPSDVVVLTRVNTTLMPVQVALSIRGVPTTGGVGAEHVERTALRAAFAWLRLGESDELDRRDLAEAVRRPSRKLHPRVREWVCEQRDVSGIRRLATRLNNERDARSVEAFAADIEQLHAMQRRGATTSELLHQIVDVIGLASAVANLDDARRGTNTAAQGDDLLAVAQLADLYDHHGSGPFEPWLRKHLSTSRHDDGVMLSTVHRVKGQQWPHVVVHLADRGQFPHRLAVDVEEERRLFHVAITRASIDARIVSGRSPSRFVDELTTEPATTPPDGNTTANAEPTRTPATGAKQVGSRHNRSAHPLTDRSTVLAAVGLTLVDNGQHWQIIDLDPDAAVAAHGAAKRRFPVGSKVETVGRQRGTLAARPGIVSEASVRAFDALRVFRSKAKGDKPAYTVFDDQTLAAIADAVPTDLDELVAVRGVGPAKLDAYGDDVLAIIMDTATPVLTEEA